MGKRNFKYKVTTESGATYHLSVDGSFARYTSSEGFSESFPSYYLGFREDVDTLRQLYGKSFFPAIIEAFTSKEPVVGMSIYASSFSSWRLSTPISTIEEL